MLNSTANSKDRKSQLAIEYAYQVRDWSPDTWVFWVHASSAERFEEGYRNIARSVKMAGWGNLEVDILRLVNSWLSDEANGQWLMIIDNADSDISTSAERSKVGNNIT
jgi:hypothetical protein